MKLTFVNGTLRGDSCIRAVAVINKSKKNGIVKRHQKTWSAPALRPDVSRDELKVHLTNEAKRWEAKVMAAIKEQNETQNHAPQDTRIPLAG